MVLAPTTPMKEIWDKVNPKHLQVFTAQFTIAATGQSDNQQIDFGQAYNYFITKINFDIYDKTEPSGTRILPTSSTVDPILIEILMGTSYQLISGAGAGNTSGGMTIFQFNDMWNNNYISRGWRPSEQTLSIKLSHVAINSTARYTFPLIIYMTMEGYKLDGAAR